MRTFVFIPLLLACSLPCQAQTKSDTQLTPQVRLYRPQNLTAARAAQVALFVRNYTNFAVFWDPVPNSFVIRSNKPEEQEAAVAILKRFDVPEPPEPRIEVTIYLIRAAIGNVVFPEGRARFPGVNTSDTPVPPELKPVVDEMKGAFKYDHYSLWDAITIKPTGNGEVQGMLPTEPAAKNYVYTVSYGLGPSPSDNAVTLSPFLFALRMPQPQAKEDLDSHIKTDVTIHDGEKLVLGKIRLLPMANADLFLVLTSKQY